MTVYLLKGSLSLLLLFVFYKVALENERMHTFKRFYLLGGLLFSAVVPLFSVEIEPSVTELVSTLPEQVFVQRLSSVPMLPPTPEATTPPYWLMLYGFVTLVLLGRFGHNLYRLVHQITKSPKQAFRGATLIQLATDTLPYTFWSYLFVPAIAYSRGEIEEELYTHELAHIRQRHSLDVLLIELLLCLAWFNPLLYWYRRAMQLNHEFLADEAVNEGHRNVPQYQRLLLSKLTPTPLPLLASTLTFQTTKQRLLMMTKRTSRRTVWLAGTITTGLLAALTMLLGTTQAQPASTKSGTPIKAPKVANETEAERLLRLYGSLSIAMPNGKEKKYAELSAAERQNVQVLEAPALPELRTPTEAQWKAWQDPHKFGIWIDGKRLRDRKLSSYQRTDIVAFFGSYVHKNARQPEGYLYQMDLLTKQGYEVLVKERKKEPIIMVMTFPKKPTTK